MLQYEQDREIVGRYKCMKKYVYNESFKDKFLKKLYLFKLDIQIFFKYNKDVTSISSFN